MRKVNIPALSGCHNQTDPLPRFDYQLFAKKRASALIGCSTATPRSARSSQAMGRADRPARTSGLPILNALSDGSVEIKFITSGRLRCSPVAALSLRNAIDASLKMLEQPQQAPAATAKLN
jgi:hypothetical protein